MPSLQERLQALEDYLGGGHPLYPMFEALVKALEPQECPQGCDAIIRKLRHAYAGATERLGVRRAMCDSWEGRCHKAGRELAAAQAEIGRLKQQVSDMAATLALRSAEVDQWQHLVALARMGEEKAKVEIERLHKEHTNAEQDERDCENCLAELKADAAIGRAVRDMRDASCLYRFRGGSFGVGIHIMPHGWTPLGLDASVFPTNALAHISKEAHDAEV